MENIKITNSHTDVAGQRLNQPKLRFPEFKGEWERKKLGDVATITTGSTPSTVIPEYYNGKKLFVSPADMQGNRYIKNTKTTLTELGFSKGRKIPKGSVLFVCIGSTIGKVGIANEDCLTNQQINALYGNTNYINEFIFSLLENNGSEIKLLAGIQAVPQINKTDFSNLSFSFPTLPEQIKIANFLTAVDEKIQALKKKKNLLEQYKKGVMQRLFLSESGCKGLNDEQDFDETNPTILKSSKSRFRQLRFKDDNGKAFPEWEVKKLGEVANFRRGSFPQPYGLPKWYDDENGMPFIQVYDVDDNMLLKPQTKNKISDLGAKQSVFVKKGTLVITIQGSIGRIAKTQYDAYIDRTLLIFQSFKADINVDYFKFVVFLLFEIEKTKAPGGTIKTITKEVLTDFIVPIPCIEEQTKIANFLSSIDEKINHTETQIQQSQEWKKGLLQQMFC